MSTTGHVLKSLNCHLKRTDGIHFALWFGHGKGTRAMSAKFSVLITYRSEEQQSVIAKLDQLLFQFGAQNLKVFPITLAETVAICRNRDIEKSFYRGTRWHANERVLRTKNRTYPLLHYITPLLTIPIIPIVST